MNTAVINIKTDAKVKTQAQRIAAQMGFSLSSLINGYLRQLTRTKTVSFTLNSEEPSEYLIQALKESEADKLAGRTSPAFENADDAIAWLENPHRKYGSKV